MNAKRFGCFKYGERDGEISFEHSHLTMHGVDKEELDRYFHSVISAATLGLDTIRKYCAGRFKKQEVEEIFGKIRILVQDLKEE